MQVYAASSLTDVMKDIAALNESTAVEIELHFAGSATLREQILDGAEVDVFISANQAVMADLERSGAVGLAVPIVENSMAIAVPIGNPGRVRKLSDLEESHLVLGMCAQGVPCGDLARNVLDSAHILVEPDTYEPNVRSLLSKVELGELDAALVYLTDVLASGLVEHVVVDEAFNGRTTYVAAVAVEADERAAQFVSFLTSDVSLSVFDAAGFTSP